MNDLYNNKKKKKSCRAHATKALLLRGYYKGIQKTLFEVSKDAEESGKSRVIASSLYKKKTSKIETVLGRYLGTSKQNLKRKINESSLPHRNNFDLKSYLPVVDRLEPSLRPRLEAYKQVDTRFGFLNKRRDY